MGSQNLPPQENYAPLVCKVSAACLDNYAVGDMHQLADSKYYKPLEFLLIFNSASHSLLKCSANLFFFFFTNYCVIITCLFILLFHK